MSNKWVYLFNEVEKAEEHAGSWDGVRSLLGGKGANVAEMTRLLGATRLYRHHRGL